MTPKDYSVVVTGLPYHVTKKEIVDHFSTLYVCRPLCAEYYEMGG